MSGVKSNKKLPEGSELKKAGNPGHQVPTHHGPKRANLPLIIKV